MTLPDRTALKPLPNSAANVCFGCGPSNPSGIRLQFSTDGKTVYSFFSIPAHLSGWHSLAHGGVLFTVLDEVMGRTIMYNRQCFVMTKSIQMDFRKPVPTGQEMAAVSGAVEVTGDREAAVEAEIRNAEGVVCAKARGIFATFTREAAQKLGIAHGPMLEWFDAFVRA